MRIFIASVFHALLEIEKEQCLATGKLGPQQGQTYWGRGQLLCIKDHEHECPGHEFQGRFDSRTYSPEIIVSLK